MSKKPNVVLVHGAWADGSCWSAVIQSLQKDGYTVTAPQFPETSLAADVARLRQVSAATTVGPYWRGESRGVAVAEARTTPKRMCRDFDPLPASGQRSAARRPAAPCVTRARREVDDRADRRRARQPIRGLKEETVR